MTHASVLFARAATLAALLAACDDDGEHPAPAASCLLDTDCKDGEYCSGNATYCSALPDHYSYPDGATCKRIKASLNDSCTKNEDCSHPGLHCAYGRCLPSYECPAQEVTPPDCDSSCALGRSGYNTDCQELCFCFPCPARDGG